MKSESRGIARIRPVRMHDDEYAKVMAAARKAGKATFSAYVRHVLGLPELPPGRPKTPVAAPEADSR